MDMGLVHMGGHHKLVLRFGELHSQLIANVVGFLRADLPRLEGLDHPVHDNAPACRLAAPSDLMIELLADFKFLGGGFRGAHIGGYPLTIVGFYRLLVVIQALLYGPLPGSVLHGVSRENFGNCHGCLLLKCK